MTTQTIKKPQADPRPPMPVRHSALGEAPPQQAADDNLDNFKRLKALTPSIKAYWGNLAAFESDYTVHAQQMFSGYREAVRQGATWAADVWGGVRANTRAIEIAERTVAVRRHMLGAG